MNLFDKEFFPTPPEVIKIMAAPYSNRLAKATILEPSAGNGAILDYICNTGVPGKYDCRIKANPNRLYAIEHNPELQMILQQKHYRVIASDFLTFQPEHRFNLILMNPPFSNGDRHLLHAWEILQEGDIACLLNAETIRNTCTGSRERLKAIIGQYGSVEFLGQAFKDADNPTDVEVALVRLHKESTQDPFKLDLEGFANENAPDFKEMAASQDAVAVGSRLDAYIRCWELTKASAMDFIKAFARFRFFADSFLKSTNAAKEFSRGENLTEAVLKDLSELRYTSDSMTDIYNRFLDKTKASAWSVIFEEIGLGKYMTTGLKRKLDEFRTAQGSIAITKENIQQLFRFIMTNVGTIMDQSIVEVYDLFTRYFKGNTSCNEGWKTNKQFRCNRKIILPDFVTAGFMHEKYGYDEYFDVSWTHGETLNDIDKAMCWLTGRNYNTLTDPDFDTSKWNKSRRNPTKNDKIATAIKTIRVGDQGWHDSAFFRIRAFKKGTIHLEFKDEDVWNRFNIAVNKGKNILGMAE